MGHTSFPVRLGLWRVTRHPASTRLYDWLAAAGVVVARLDRFTRDARSGTSERDGVVLEDGFVETARPSGDVPEHLDDAHLAPADRLVFARRETDVIGVCCVADRPVYVPELRRRLRFPGAYVWRLYVTPTARGEGVGAALIDRAIDVAHAEFEADAISALIAPDNLPSRAAFDSLAFRPVARFTTVGCLGTLRHSRTDLGSGT